MFKTLQRLARIMIVITLIVACISCLVTVGYVHGIHLASRQPAASLAFWLSHDYSTAAAMPSSFATLQEKIQTYSVDTLYFHVGPLSENGQLATDLSISPKALAALSTTNYAWIGQVRSKINLQDPLVRSSIIESATWAIAQGFDGIHLDIEPVREEDTAFFQLVQELRTALPGVKLSLAMDEWQPVWLSNWVANSFNVPIESYWSTEQVQTLAPHIDELVVMTYDTNFHNPKLYEWWVEQQTVALSQIVPQNVTVRVGIPAYKQGLALDPNTENLYTGITGFTRGVQNLRSNPSRLAGLAIYPYWEMEEGDWKILGAFLNTLTPDP